MRSRSPPHVREVRLPVAAALVIVLVERGCHGRLRGRSEPAAEPPPLAELPALPPAPEIGRAARSPIRPGPSRSAGGARWPSARTRPGGSCAACASRRAARASSPGIRSSGARRTDRGGVGAPTGCCAFCWTWPASRRAPARDAHGDRRPHPPPRRRLRPAVRVHRPREPSERARRGRLLPALRRPRASAAGRYPDRPAIVPGAGGPLPGPRAPT